MRTAYTKLEIDDSIWYHPHSDTPYCPIYDCSQPRQHDCGCCFLHCRCVLCIHCQRVIVQDLCVVCQTCPTCCQCFSCRSCVTVYASESLLCNFCGNGLNCCCIHNQNSNVAEQIRQRHAVNLALYVDPKPPTSQYPSRRLLAAEIELCGFTKADGTNIYEILSSWHASAVSDGSLPGGGIELNTHPAGGEFWVSQIQDICTAVQARGAWVNDRAGCHIHVDCRDANYLDLAKIIRVLSCAEMLFFGMIPCSRRLNRFCTMWAWNYLVALRNVEKSISPNEDDRIRLVKYREVLLKALYGFSSKSDVEKVKRNKSHQNRYRGINLHSFLHRGTIELRIPPGTIYATNIINWGFLVAYLVDYAKASSMTTVIRDSLSIEEAISKLILRFGSDYEYNSVAMKYSQEYVLSILPNSVVKDWIHERIKWASTVTDFCEESPE